MASGGVVSDALAPLMDDQDLANVAEKRTLRAKVAHLEKEQLELKKRNKLLASSLRVSRGQYKRLRGHLEVALEQHQQSAAPDIPLVADVKLLLKQVTKKKSKSSSPGRLFGVPIGGLQRQSNTPQSNTSRQRSRSLGSHQASVSFAVAQPPRTVTPQRETVAKFIAGQVTPSKSPVRNDRSNSAVRRARRQRPTTPTQLKRRNSEGDGLTDTVVVMPSPQGHSASEPSVLDSDLAETETDSVGQASGDEEGNDVLAGTSTIALLEDVISVQEEASNARLEEPKETARLQQRESLQDNGDSITPAVREGEDENRPSPQPFEEDTGHPDTETRAQQLYDRGMDSLQAYDLAGARALLEEAAELGSLDALDTLGETLEQMAYDLQQEAERCWERGALENHFGAMFNLGRVRDPGLGLAGKKSETEAVELWTKAAEGGHSLSQRSLGLYYLEKAETYCHSDFASRALEYLTLSGEGGCTDLDESLAVAQMLLDCVSTPLRSFLEILALDVAKRELQSFKWAASEGQLEEPGALASLCIAVGEKLWAEGLPFFVPDVNSEIVEVRSLGAAQYCEKSLEDFFKWLCVHETPEGLALKEEIESFLSKLRTRLQGEIDVQTSLAKSVSLPDLAKLSDQYFLEEFLASFGATSIEDTNSPQVGQTSQESSPSPQTFGDPSKREQDGSGTLTSSSGRLPIIAVKEEKKEESNVARGKTFAVLIGVGKTGGDKEHLFGVYRDINNLKGALEHMFGEAVGVATLTDNDCLLTKQHILEQLLFAQAAVMDCQRNGFGTQFLCYFAGHSHLETRGHIPFLLPSNVLSANACLEGFSLMEIFRIFTLMSEPNGNQLVPSLAMIDSCHSGAVVDRPDACFRRTAESGEACLTVVASCEEHQETEEDDSGGDFTKSVIERMRLITEPTRATAFADALQGDFNKACGVTVPQPKSRRNRLFEFRPTD